MNIEFDLDDIDNMLKFIETLKKKIEDSTEQIAKELIDLGEKTAQENIPNEWQSNIKISSDKKKSKSKDETKVRYMMTVTDTPIRSEWRGANGKVEGYDVSPMLLAEFGSGWLSDVRFDSMQGIVGQGTMPNAKGHAFDPMGWGWRDLNGEYHRSIGVRPSYPLYRATTAMRNEAESIAEKVLFYEMSKLGKR